MNMMRMKKKGKKVWPKTEKMCKRARGIRDKSAWNTSKTRKGSEEKERYKNSKHYSEGSLVRNLKEISRELEISLSHKQCTHFL